MSSTHSHHSLLPCSLPVITTKKSAERVPEATDLLSQAFKADPTITYLLSSLTAEQRELYRPTFFRAILSAAAMNDASFDEINGWKSCGVIVPPGCQVDSLGTLLPAGFLSVVWSIGFGGCQAGAG